MTQFSRLHEYYENVNQLTLGVGVQGLATFPVAQNQLVHAILKQ